MTNEKLLEQMANGDEAALTTLCLDWLRSVPG